LAKVRNKVTGLGASFGGSFLPAQEGDPELTGGTIRSFGRKKQEHTEQGFSGRFTQRQLGQEH